MKIYWILKPISLKVKIEKIIIIKVEKKAQNKINFFAKDNL